MPGCGRAFGSVLRIEAQWDPLLLLSDGTGSRLSGDGGRGKLRDLLERLGLCGDWDGSGRLFTSYDLECGPFRRRKKVSDGLEGHVGHPGGLLLLVDRAVKTGPERT